MAKTLSIMYVFKLNVLPTTYAIVLASSWYRIDVEKYFMKKCEYLEPCFASYNISSMKIVYAKNTL
jgi:hypothetical protein